MSLELLENSFRKKIEALVEDVRSRGVVMVPYRTKLEIKDQVFLWGKSRSETEREELVEYLKENSAFKLAELVSILKPTFGSQESDIHPGLSWHLYGRAVDFVWQLPNGRFHWNPYVAVDGVHGYYLLRDRVKELELVHESSLYGFHHVQEFEETPLERYKTWKKLEANLFKR